MYTHIKTADDLKTAIGELKIREQRKKQELKANFHAFTDSMKPGNLIRNSFNKITSGNGIANTVLKASVGLGVGLLSKKLIVGQSNSIVKKLAGQAVKLGMAGLIARKSDQIKLAGLKILSNILGKRKRSKIIV